MSATTARHHQPYVAPSAFRLTVVFMFATVLSGLGMSSLPGTYDEGIVLVGGMRTLVGQMPHQDFYANYGPLDYYTMGWLFRVFGVSLLPERILYAIISGLIVAAIYGICARYCRPRVVQWTVLSILLWLSGLNSVSGSMIYPVSLFNLLCVALVLAVFVQRISLSTLLGVGVLTGVSALFRYDTGVALFGTVSILLGFGSYVRLDAGRSRLKEFAADIAAYLLGFVAVTVPALLYYLSRGRFENFLHDIVVYPSKYYPRARHLPLPGSELTLKSVGKLIVYLPLILSLMAIYTGVRGCLAARGKSREEQDGLVWHGALASFGLLGLVMYLKGIVRASPPQMYLSTVPALLAVAILYEHRGAFRRSVAVAIVWLFCLSVGIAGAMTVRELHDYRTKHLSLAVEMFHEVRGTLPPLEAAWCKTPGPLTKGVCFLPDDDRIQTIEFLRSHTKPGDKLFLGVPHHDVIYGNDNITYFATDRLPVTKWSHFDPLIQNELPVQKEMVREFEADPPPYIVLDAEYESVHEPNDSSKSTGVTFLDEYLHSHYALVETHGMLSIYRRM